MKKKAGWGERETTEVARGICKGKRRVKTTVLNPVDGSFL